MLIVTPQVHPPFLNIRSPRGLTLLHAATVQGAAPKDRIGQDSTYVFFLQNWIYLPCFIVDWTFSWVDNFQIVGILFATYWSMELIQLSRVGSLGDGRGY